MMATSLSDRQIIYMDLVEMHDGDSFGAKDYAEAFESGKLGKMHFKCADESSVGKLRNRLLSAARTRDHILHTTQTTVDEYKPDGYYILTVTYLGKLPPPHERP